MEKINANLLAKIRTAAFPDELSAIAVRLSVAKNVFVIAASLYFTCYLFAVGGFVPEVTGMLAYLMFPAFLLSVCVFAYELVGYWAKVYADNAKYARYAALAVCSILFIA